jgi:hypothetical protein
MQDRRTPRSARQGPRNRSASAPERRDERDVDGVTAAADDDPAHPAVSLRASKLSATAEIGLEPRREVQRLGRRHDAEVGM